MNVREIISAPKTIKSTGQWDIGTMPRAAFPLSKSSNRAYRLGNRRWRVVQFTSRGLVCRVLINYSAALAQYQATLGVDFGSDVKVLASLELHPTHGGWHAHACCDDVSTVPAGIKRGPWVRNLNGCGVKHRMPCPSDDDSAFNRAVSFFCLDRIERGGML